MTEFRTKGKGKERKVYPMKKQAYGISRELAYEDVVRLREEGKRARLIETNKNHKLYAPYESDLPLNKQQNAPVDSRPAPATKEGAKAASSETLNLPKKKKMWRDVIMTTSGEGNQYVAIIDGPDPKYHYKRRFIQQMKTHEGGSRKHPIYAARFEGKLPYGTIVETPNGSWMIVPVSKRYPNGFRDIYLKGMKNRVKMNKLFAAREKAGYDRVMNPEK